MTPTLIAQTPTVPTARPVTLPRGGSGPGNVFLPFQTIFATWQLVQSGEQYSKNKATTEAKVNQVRAELRSKPEGTVARLTPVFVNGNIKSFEVGYYKNADQANATFITAQRTNGESRGAPLFVMISNVCPANLPADRTVTFSR